MKRAAKESRWVSVLTVKVSGPQGLVEMMRYDRCCPYTEEESRKIMKLIGDEQCGSSEATAADHVVRLMRFAANDLPATEGRWRSFNCRVLDERSPQETQLDDAEILNLAKVTR